MASLPQTQGYQRHRNQNCESEDSTSSSDVSIPNMAETPPTRQLDFYQAMADFRQMFPNMEEEVIEAVLRANNGAVDPTIEQLLAMNVDSDGSLGPAGKIPAGLSQNPQHAKITIPSGLLLDSSSSEDEDLPPSYNEYTKNLAKDTPQAASPVATTGTVTVPKVPQENVAQPAAVSGNLLDMDEEDLEWQLQGATGYTPSTADTDVAPHKQAVVSALEDDFNPSPPAPPMPPKMNLLQHEYTPRHRPPMAEPGFRPPPKRTYKNWNPPLLGNLPDDFLRIIITPKELPQPKPVPMPVHTCGMHGHFPQTLPSTHAHSHQPSSQPSHHRGQLSRSMTAPTRPSGSPKSTRSPQSARAAVGTHGSRSPGQGSLSPVHKPRTVKLARSASASQPSAHTHIKRTLVASHGSEELDSGTIQLKIAENERKQSSASNPEQAQILADEHLALMMQNEEFLTVLRHDEDFMRTLERDRMNATAFERPGTPDFPELDSNRPPKDQIEGYGHDHQRDLGAFPFAQPAPGSDNAEFCRQLHHMGGSSRKKFAALAKKFFTRKKKKTPKQLLKDTVAPSTANLLEEDDDEDESPGPRGEGHAADTASVPSHMTVQRPMYHPDTVVTHHRSCPYDMV